MRRTWILRGAGALLLAAGLVAGSCIPQDHKLNIPYRAQEQFNYCTPAAVLMWRLYDGLVTVSQTTIFNWMGGTGNTNQINVANAVNYFTNTRDAYWDSGSPTTYRQMAARQITAFDRSIPSIVVINYDHVVIVNGGSWHTDPNYRVWDEVFAHDPDPFWGANRYFSAGSWIYSFCPPGNRYCDQIISSGATYDWSTNYTTYNDTKIYGWDHDLGGPLPY
ncbi:MAG TPA: hypothetical protein VEW48_14960 [Thermoanaerobaculia bacterium]|nr:hypothetical protein [Thermoanaerobaculia bacterium]